MKRKNISDSRADGKGDKTDVNCQNTLGCLDQYIRRELRPWNSREHETV